MTHPHDARADRLLRNRLTRRDTLWVFSASVGASVLPGCATPPASGEVAPAGLREEQERQVDTQLAPYQFSLDLGAVQEAEVNAYLGRVSQSLQEQVRRHDMPYSVRALNAHYVNAYTCPGGAIGVTRGLLVELQDESELAALLGQELGHVNARHVAQRQGQAMVAQVAMASLTVAGQDANWSPLLGLGSQIGASALLANYSRDQEHQADALGLEYLVGAGYPATGMTQLHARLVSQHKAQPGMLETMFASHPMSNERLATAREAAETRYAGSLKAPRQRERYMDSTASLRRLRPAIEACKNGELAMGRQALSEAQGQFVQALRLAPRDYAANLRMAQCLQAQGQPREALRYANAARSLYPQEAQAHKLGASLHLALHNPGAAFNALEQFDRVLPGDPGVLFMKAYALDGMGQGRRAAEHYAQFLQVHHQGEAAQFSVNRLRAMGHAIQ
ncbi:M48 family metalloprotease [Sphaerotilus sp.]|uniref:M48 family metalloprotease n=1 Tax=Sphaerotilus sp. TaxID=2093942 RepID=UPI0034E2CAD3